jgi:UDP-glucose 4-epimerase
MGKNENVEPLLNEKRILVTGGAGFIGSHLVDELLAKGHSVTVLDNLSSGVLDNLGRHRLLTFVRGDISDLNLVDRLVKHSDMVFHLAEYIPTTKSYGSGHVVKYSVDAPLQDFDVSARGTLIVLSSAKKYCKKFVFTSTAAVYGKSTSLLKESSQLIPISPYGVSKLCAEEYVRLYSRTCDLPVSIVRFFNVYGPRQLKYVMYDLLLRVKENPNYIEMLGTGEEMRDFVYVADAVKALLLVSQDEFAVGEVYNVASGQQTRIRELVDALLKVYGAHPKVGFKGSSWNGDVKQLIADISKISAIGYRPAYSLERGLRKFVDWFKSNEQM